MVICESIQIFCFRKTPEPRKLFYCFDLFRAWREEAEAMPAQKFNTPGDLKSNNDTIEIHRSNIILAVGCGVVACVVLVCLWALISYSVSETSESDSKQITIAIAAIIVLVAGFVFITRRVSHGGKEMIVLDRFGLTLKGNARVGPLPWRCIKDASIFRMGLEKHLLIQFGTKDELETMLDSESIKRISFNKKTGEGSVLMDIDLCKLRGIDLVSLIKERSRR
jgi:hypothetical protein